MRNCCHLSWSIGGGVICASHTTCALQKVRREGRSDDRVSEKAGAKWHTRRCECECECECEWEKGPQGYSQSLSFYWSHKGNILSCWEYSQSLTFYWLPESSDPKDMQSGSCSTTRVNSNAFSPGGCYMAWQP
eukprot:1195511-Prorocentrum_minimum.AAC.5